MSKNKFKLNTIESAINDIRKGKIVIDSKTCSVFYENIIRKKFQILRKEDPIYLLKAIKNKNEIARGPSFIGRVYVTRQSCFRSCRYWR